MVFGSVSDDLVELVVLFILILGFFLSIFANVIVTKFFLIFLVGLMFGKVWFDFKKRTKFALTTIIAGFLSGFILGNLFDNIRALVVIFFVGFLFSYFAHEKKWVKSYAAARK